MARPRTADREDCLQIYWVAARTVYCTKSPGHTTKDGLSLPGLGISRTHQGKMLCINCYRDLRIVLYYMYTFKNKYLTTTLGNNIYEHLITGLLLQHEHNSWPSVWLRPKYTVRGRWLSRRVDLKSCLVVYFIP